MYLRHRWKNHISFLKPDGISIFISVLAICLFTLLGCDDVERHRTLSFFLDGVPPLWEEEIVIVDPNAISGQRVRSGEVWFIHEPQRECDRCHGNREQRSFSREVQMTNTVPQLCYECHADLENLTGRVHGPVAVAECLFCHEPHKTRNEHLLRTAVPDLCFRCHESKAIALIENHEQEYYAKCLECHAGHTSERKYLLKEDYKTAMDANGKSVEVGEPNSLAEPPTQ